jgi:hypothetical protein
MLEAVRARNPTDFADRLFAAVAGDGDKGEAFLRGLYTALESRLVVAKDDGGKLNGDASAVGVVVATVLPTTHPGLGAKMTSFANVQCVQPRGRFEVAFHTGGLLLRAKSGAEVFTPWSNVSGQPIRFSKPNPYKKTEKQAFFALTLCEPVLNKKAKVKDIVFQVTSDGGGVDCSMTIALEDRNEEIVAEGGLPDAIERLMSLASQRTVLGEDVAVFGGAPLSCYSGTNEGCLHPLPGGLLFFKPLQFAPRDSISEIVCGRGGAANTRYVDLIVELDDGTTLEFTNIVRDDLPRLQDYLSYLQRKRAKSQRKRMREEKDGDDAVAVVGGEANGTTSSSSSNGTDEVAGQPATTTTTATAAATNDGDLDGDSDSDDSDDSDFGEEDGSDDSEDENSDGSMSGSCDSDSGSSDSDSDAEETKVGGASQTKKRKQQQIQKKEVKEEEEEEGDEVMDDSGFGPGTMSGDSGTESDNGQLLPVAEEEGQQSPQKKQRLLL